MTKEDDIRTQVAETYSRAVQAGGGCCGGERQTKGVVARLAGYDDAELEALPADAIQNSFGCGDPVSFSDVRPGEVVLDLGCGAGIDLLLAAQRVGPGGRVIGVDMTDEMIVRARANAAAAGRENVEVRKGFIEALPVDDGSVDLVISNCVLNLSPDKPAAFAEIARVLKPGGRMRLSDLVVDDPPQWVRESAILYSSCVAGASSEEEYVGGLRAAGLERVDVVQRLVYDKAMLGGLIASEVEAGGEALVAEAAAVLSDGAGGCGCGCSPTPPPGLATLGTLERDDLLQRAVEALEGKVASVLVTAVRGV